MRARCKTGTATTRTGVGLTHHRYSDPAQAAYAKSLGIPPNYPQVEVCHPGKVLYYAKDGKGRTQTGYSKAHAVEREDTAKPQRLRDLVGAFPRLTEAVARAIAKKRWSVDKMAATAVLLMQQCGFRPGGGPSTNFGVVTLQVRHVRFSEEGCSLEFVGKWGKTNACAVHGELCALLRGLAQRRAPDAPLFRTARRTLTVTDVRDFLRHATAVGDVYVRPKDIRTYEANLAFLRAMRETGSVATAVRRTAERLGNTPKIAKDAYILRPVLAAAVAGRLPAGSAEAALRKLLA